MKSIKDYKGKSEYAIQCHSQKEWDAICVLLDKPERKPYYLQPVSGTVTDTISTANEGWGGRSLFKSGIVFQAIEFILPDNWCLDLDKLNKSDKQVAKQYWEELPELDCDITFKGYLLSDAFDGTYMHWGNPDEYEKISFETFKDFVLVQPNMIHAVVPPDEIVVNQFPIY